MDFDAVVDTEVIEKEAALDSYEDFAGATGEDDALGVGSYKRLRRSGSSMVPTV